MPEEEKVLFKVDDLYFSNNYKDWKRVALNSTNLNMWLNDGGSWIKIPNDKSKLVEVKSAAGDSSVLIVAVGSQNVFLGGKKPVIYALYNTLLSILPTSSQAAGAIKFTDSKRLVLKALYQGIRRPENIMPLIKREYDEIVQILEEFEREGICTKAGILTEKGKLIMIEEGYR